MKKILFLSIALLCGTLFSIQTTRAANPYKGITGELLTDLQTNISAAGTNGPELQKALTEAPKNQKEGMAFLIAYMPVGDRDTLKADFLLTEVAWAYKAREVFPWVSALPDSIFYNEVLPYASLNEKREPWRAMLWEKLYPLVQGMTDERAALDTINKALKDLVGVEYNTKRRKANQSPSESMEQGMASCTGLSILLTDALRTVGIPSRIAGTPMWVTREGNHNWSEVWLNGEWYFIEYYPTPALNQSWFLERAGKADKTNPIYWIYATSWKTTGLAYMWGRTKTIPGHDVTDHYIALYNTQKAQAQEGVPLVVRLFASQSGGRASGDRVSADIRVKDVQGKMLAAGKTASSNADMNDYLTLYIPSVQGITIEFTDPAGKVHSTTLPADNTTAEVTLFLNE